MPFLPPNQQRLSTEVGELSDRKSWGRKLPIAYFMFGANYTSVIELFWLYIAILNGF